MKADDFFGREGPAEVDGSVLELTGIPPRAKLPVKVMVVLGLAGKVKTAEPVRREFLIRKKLMGKASPNQLDLMRKLQATFFN